MWNRTSLGLVFVALIGWAIVGATWPAPDLERAGSPSVTAVGSAQAAPTTGGRGLGFSCDVNTRECKCSGKWEGADCKAMQKNCDLTKVFTCAIEPPYGCTCTMARTIKRPNTSVRPTTPPTTVQGKPN